VCSFLFRQAFKVSLAFFVSLWFIFCGIGANPLFQGRVSVYGLLADTFSARAEKLATALFSEKGG
jgi:hypothetical protein